MIVVFVDFRIFQNILYMFEYSVYYYTHWSDFLNRLHLNLIRILQIKENKRGFKSKNLY